MYREPLLKTSRYIFGLLYFNLDTTFIQAKNTRSDVDYNL